MAPLDPVAPSLEHVRVREAFARERVATVPLSRVPALIVALFHVYEPRKHDAFAELMWTIEALYSVVPERILPAEACAILAATRHSCGHGGLLAPVSLAQRAYADAEYTPELFDALQVYRGELSGLRSAEATATLGEIGIILWEDPREPLKPRHCLSRGVRDGISALLPVRRAPWSRLLRYVDRSAHRRPVPKWIKAARGPLEALGAERFAADLAAWLTPPEGTVQLSTGGRHVLKTMIWFAALSRSDALDEVLPSLLDLPYAKPEAAVHLIYAIGYWLETRPPTFAEPHRERLREKWPIAGTRVRGSGSGS